MIDYAKVIADLEKRRADDSRSTWAWLTRPSTGQTDDLKQQTQAAEQQSSGWTPEQIQCVSQLIVDRLID